MDYAGDSLFALRRNHHLPLKMELPQLQSILWQLAKAIKYLHDRDIVHGDIKLENILMQEVPVELVLGLREAV